jgi:hypothetical protein
MVKTVYHSLGQTADSLNVQAWRIARLFELGVLPEPPRIGRNRAIPATMVPAIVDALRDKGWLSPCQDLDEEFCNGS